MTDVVHGGGAELDTRRLQRRMMLYYTQDGLWDLCLGACVLSWGLLTDTGMSA